jgi:hypothetical protein
VIADGVEDAVASDAKLDRELAHVLEKQLGLAPGSLTKGAGERGGYGLKIL